MVIQLPGFLLLADDFSLRDKIMIGLPSVVYWEDILSIPFDLIVTPPSSVPFLLSLVVIFIQKILNKKLMKLLWAKKTHTINYNAVDLLPKMNKLQTVATGESLFMVRNDNANAIRMQKVKVKLQFVNLFCCVITFLKLSVPDLLCKTSVLNIRHTLQLYLTSI